MKKCKYMHTINGEPADFNGEQIVFSDRSRPIKLAPTLAAIHQERKKSNAWRLKEGFSDTTFSYSHRRVVV